MNPSRYPKDDCFESGQWGSSTVYTYPEAKLKSFIYPTRQEEKSPSVPESIRCPVFQTKKSRPDTTNSSMLPSPEAPIYPVHFPSHLRTNNKPKREYSLPREEVIRDPTPSDTRSIYSETNDNMSIGSQSFHRTHNTSQSYGSNFRGFTDLFQTTGSHKYDRSTTSGYGSRPVSSGAGILQGSGYSLNSTLSNTTGNNFHTIRIIFHDISMIQEYSLPFDTALEAPTAYDNQSYMLITFQMVGDQNSVMELELLIKGIPPGEKGTKFIHVEIKANQSSCQISGNVDNCTTMWKPVPSEVFRCE